MRLCAVPGCERRYASRGLCAAHLYRMRRTGELRPDVPIAATDEARFWAKVDKSGDCWIWQGAKTTRGHGQFGTGSRVTYAHRFAYEHTVGAIPEDHILHHRCSNPACVNPTHIETMTQAEHAALHRRLRFPTN